MDTSKARLGKVFHDCSHHISSLEFDHCGEHCLVGCPGDESIILYDALAGLHRKTVYSKKYGVGPVRLAHRTNNVIYASGKGDETLRYLSLHDNAYLRYFRGHEARVTALEVSPLDDTFISAAANDTIRLWDLRTVNCHGVLAINGKPLIAYDPQGLVFAVALDSRYIRLYDVSGYERGPFACFEIVDPQRPQVVWNLLRFSPDGKDVMIGTLNGVVYIIDAFDGYVKQTLQGVQNSTQLDLQPTFSTDAKQVLCGSQDGKIHIWDRDTGHPVGQLEGHSVYPGMVRCNPHHAMIASACTNLAFWS
jgi:COMPASS component SWD2